MIIARCLLGCCLAAALLALAGAIPRSNAKASTLSNAVALFVDECLDCSMCTDDTRHTAPGPAETGNAWGIAHSHCSAIGNCFLGHFHEQQNCSGFRLSAQESQEIAALIDGADARGLLELSRRIPDVVRYVRERNAVQVLGCTGLVRAHFPIEPGVVAAQ